MRWGELSNYPPGVTDNDPYFNQEDDDTCEHSAPTCEACRAEEEKADAEGAYETSNRD